MIRKQKFFIFISLIFVTGLGLGFKFYRGYGQEWLNNYLAGVWYEVFWCLFFFWFIHQKKAVLWIPVWVFIVTCVLEFLQLWHPPLLELIRSYVIGRLFLGSSFSWWDFPNYLIGCLLGWFLLRQIEFLDG